MPASAVSAPSSCRPPLRALTVVAKEKKLGQRASDTCQIAFEDVEVTPDMLLGEEGQGYRIALANLEAGRVAIAAQATGIARAALEAATSLRKRERETFGTPIINHQAVAFRLADMATRLEAMRQLTLHAARLRDEGTPCITEASMAKLFASETAEEASVPTPFRSMAATAMWRASRLSACIAMCGSARSTRAPRMSSAW